MKNPKIYASLGLAIVLTAALGHGVWSQDPDVTRQARLSADQVQSLRAAGIPVAVPTDLPPGFEVSAISIDPTIPDDPFSGGYVLAYRQVSPTFDTPLCFEVEAAKGGFGGPVPEHQTTALLPSFAQPLEDMADYTYQLFWSDGGDHLAPFSSPMLFSDWIRGDRAYYRIASLTSDDTACAVISPETANQILSSLEYLD